MNQESHKADGQDRPSRNPISVFWLTALVVLLLDRLTKLLVVYNMKPSESIPLVPGVFHLTYVRNPGAAFGVLAHQRWFFLFVAVIVISFVIYYSRQIGPSHKMLQFGLGLQLGGAVGNMIDRALTGLVVDFLDFRIWPVFNVADSAIVVGTAIVVFTLLREPGSKVER